MPLANAFLASPEEGTNEARYPLAVTACPACQLVQLTHVVPAEQLYRNYIYVSATSETVKAHAAWLARELVTGYGWDRRHLLVEVASNDGTVLSAFQRAGLRVLGVEPAGNVAAIAEANGVPTHVAFFTAATAQEIASRHGRAACVLGRHVFAHVDDLHDFLEGVCVLLEEHGVFVVEVPYVGDLLANLEFDTIYHEHLSYLSLAPLVRLCDRHGLRLVDVDRVGLHGGSVILRISRAASRHAPSRRLEQMLEEERARAWTSPQTLQRFGERVREWRGQMSGFIGDLRQQGARLIGYGAAAKGNTLLNYCPALAEALDGILDRNPLKHGRFTPGTHLKVKPAEQWAQADATHMVILAWNFKEEIMRQMQPFAQRGGRFLIPIPQPEILGAGGERCGPTMLAGRN